MPENPRSNVPPCRAARCRGVAAAAGISRGATLAMPSRRLFLGELLAASFFMAEAADAQGNSNGGGSGNGAGNSSGNAGGGASAGRSENATGTKNTAKAAPAPKVEQPSSVPRSLRLRHRNGFEEEIGAGRYEMRDNRGRRIVNRAARASDYTRLRRLMRWRAAG